jgi:mRNA interferase HigB
MRVISRKPLYDFANRFPASTNALNDWWKKTEVAEWNNFADIKKTFNSVDSIGDNRFVFNIRGNNIRLVGMIFFEKKKVYVRGVLIHPEYEALNAGNKLKTL